MIKKAVSVGMALIAMLLFSANLFSQEVLAAKDYQVPPEEVKNIVLAPRHQNISLTNLSPDGRFFLNSHSDGLTPLERMAIPFMNIGGREIDTVANRLRSLTTGGSIGYELIPAEGGDPTPINLPSDARFSGARFSPDGSQMAFFAHYKDETHIYVANTDNGRTRRITRRPVLATMSASFQWSMDGQYILTILVPSRRGEKPKEFVPENYLRVRMYSDGRNNLRTFPNLLEDAYEESMFVYYATGQISRINVRNRRIDDVGEPGLYSGISFAPDGEYLRVTTVTEPFSNIVPVSSFGNVNELWDIEGNVLQEISSREMTEGVRSPRRDNGEPQKRQLRWRPDGVGMSYLLMEPEPENDNDDNGNNDNNDNDRKDQVIQWLPPYGDDDIEVIYRSENEISSLDYSPDCQILFITESSGGRQHTYAVFLDNPEEKYTIRRHRTADFYENPGSLMMTSEDGERVVRISDDNNYVYLSGTQYHREWAENAPIPFIDRVEIKTGESERLFESSENYFERVRAIFDNNLDKYIISREAPTVIADFYLVDRASGRETRLTNNIDFSPEITNARYEMIEVKRLDGVRFWATIVLPQDYRDGEKLPAMFWFYPREYTSQSAIDRTKRAYNKNSFNGVGVRSMQILTTLGYAVILPDFPILGPSGRMNDFYVPEIQRNWQAIIDAVDELGYIDRNRLSLGGHSYGAFGTANSMIHTSFFRAGIAGAGNYNRMLTPITFQSERRWLWEARQTYLEMSSILWADRLDGALLMYHGTIDSNVGTWPINSERMFHALNGLGKPVSLYMYPYEGHGQSGRETLLDMWARWVEWLDKYVKNPEVEEKDDDDDDDDGTE